MYPVPEKSSIRTSGKEKLIEKDIGVVQKHYSNGSLTPNMVKKHNIILADCFFLPCGIRSKGNFMFTAGKMSLDWHYVFDLRSNGL